MKHLEIQKDVLDRVQDSLGIASVCCREVSSQNAFMHI
jgi:hypothetical protein